MVHPENLANVHLFALGPEAPALRGTFKHSPPSNGAWSDWESWRMDRGLPRWSNMWENKDFWDGRGKGKATQPIALADEEAELEGAGLLGEAEGEPGLREWCERYTADPGLLKEFRLRKGIWGWEFSGLTTGMSTGWTSAECLAVKGAITSTGYTSNHVEVKLRYSRFPTHRAAK